MVIELSFSRSVKLQKTWSQNIYLIFTKMKSRDVLLNYAFRCSPNNRTISEVITFIGLSFILGLGGRCMPNIKYQNALSHSVETI